MLCPGLVGRDQSGVVHLIATVDRAEAGAANGVVSTVQRVGSAVGIAIIGSVLLGSLMITGPDTVASGFTGAASNAITVSAAFSLAALLLVFALPKRTGGPGPAAPRARPRSWPRRPPDRTSHRDPGVPPRSGRPTEIGEDLTATTRSDPPRSC